MIDDAALLRQYAEECSEEAFAELVRRHLDLVHSAALRQLGGDVHRARDVAQSVFTDLARKASSLSRRPMLVGWLHISTHHAAAAVVRAEQRRRAREQEAQTMHENSGGFAPDINWDKLRPVLDTAIHELKGSDREAVLLRFFARRPFAEIGAALCLNEDAARKRVDRALDRLRAMLARRGITSTATALAIVLENQAVVAAPANWASTVTAAALTGATTTGGGTVTALKVLNFMSTTKITPIIAVAVAMLITGTAAHEVLASRAAEVSSVAAKQDYDALLGHLQELVQRAKAAEQDKAQLKKRVDEAQAAQAAEESRMATEAQTAKIAASHVRDPMSAGRAFLTAHPEVKQALVARSKARVAGRFHSLYQSLGLTPAQIEQFESLLIERDGVVFPTDQGELALNAGTGLPNNEVEARIHALLGEAGYQQYQKANQLVPARELTTQLASTLYFTDTPLTSQQADQLAQIISSSKADPNKTLSGRYDWDTIASKSQGVLSDPQLAALRGMQQQDQFNQSLKQTIKRSQLPAGNATGNSSK